MVLLSIYNWLGKYRVQADTEIKNSQKMTRSQSFNLGTKITFSRNKLPALIPNGPTFRHWRQIRQKLLHFWSCIKYCWWAKRPSLLSLKPTISTLPESEVVYDKAGHFYDWKIVLPSLLKGFFHSKTFYLIHHILRHILKPRYFFKFYVSYRFIGFLIIESFLNLRFCPRGFKTNN